MFVSEALEILGLKWSERRDVPLINRTWKNCIKHIHPDKNLDAADATAMAQTLNEARYTLLNDLEDRTKKKQRENEEELIARAKDEEAKRQQQQQKEESSEKDQAESKKPIIRRRAHRRIDKYNEGKEMIKEMQMLFKKKLVRSHFSLDRVYFNDIMDIFLTSRDQINKEEKNFFRRHCTRLLLDAFPHAKYSVHKNRRCFLYISVM
jgi:hypothetical protein